MTLEELKKKRIAILGLGVNNLALTKWLLAHRVPDVTICDQNPAIRLDHPDWESQVTWRLGSDYLDHLIDFQMIFRTPGIPYLSPQMQQAKAAGVSISSQTKLFFDLCPARIIGVTGTKGKGTTATLIYEMLKKDRSQSQVYLAGNIGKDPFDFLDKLTEDDWVVLELSSFQLQDMEVSPHIAVVLDITGDHLDHHKTTDEYVQAKASIVRYQTPGDYAVLNADSLTSVSFADQTKAQVWYFSRRKSVDQGAFVHWTEGQGSRWGEVLLRYQDGNEYPIIRTYDLKIRGEHNLENVTAAVTAGHLAGVPVEVLRQTVAEFRGLPHRLEPVGNHHGIAFYNDSLATNPDPVIAAVKSFSEPVHLIVGGSSKGADFSQLARVIKHDSTVISLIPLGDVEGAQIANLVQAIPGGNAIAIHPPTHSMSEAVEAAIRTAKPGDVVLLSPGAASFDLFKNAKERGEAYRREVHKITGEPYGA